MYENLVEKTAANGVKYSIVTYLPDDESPVEVTVEKKEDEDKKEDKNVQS